MQIIATSKAGRVYTLEPYRHLDYASMQYVRHRHLKWKGLCDGQICGLFRTRKEWEQFVEMEPDAPQVTEAQYHAMRETFSTWKGHQILHAFIAAQKAHLPSKDAKG
jgi:hypothetical protein